MFYLCYLQKLIFHKTWYCLKIWHTPFSHSTFPLSMFVPFFMSFLHHACCLFANTSSFLWEHKSVVHCLKSNSVQCLSCPEGFSPLQQGQVIPKWNGKEAVSPRDLSYFMAQAMSRLWNLHPHAEGLCLPLAQESRLHHCTQWVFKPVI